ncbi:MAG: hypothetical protein WCE79_04500 [Xanthobacteraceae bacterium]
MVKKRGPSFETRGHAALLRMRLRTAGRAKAHRAVPAANEMVARSPRCARQALPALRCERPACLRGLPVANLNDTIEARLQLRAHGSIGLLIAGSQIAIVREFQELDVGIGERNMQLALRLKAQIRQLRLRYLASIEDAHENSDHFLQVAFHRAIPLLLPQHRAAGMEANRMVGRSEEAPFRDVPDPSRTNDDASLRRATPAR